MADVLTFGRAAALREFFVDLAKEPFVFGHCDCSMVLSDWVSLARGIDPLASYRGRYSDDAGWRALADEKGGLQELLADAFEGAGLRRVPIDEARIGDVAVVKVHALDMVAGAIRATDGWVLKLQRGLCRLRVQPLAVWRV